MYTIRRNTIIRQGDGLVCFRSPYFDALKTKCDDLNARLLRYIGGGRSINHSVNVQRKEWDWGQNYEEHSAHSGEHINVLGVEQ